MKSIYFFLGIAIGFFSSCHAQPVFNFQQEGIASYYNNALIGNMTAGNEVFSQDSLTAAHPSLPMGTKVLVTNLKNQKKVWVRINDRGPFVNGRILDLTMRAADSLGMLQDGITKVFLQAYVLPQKD